jgi:hypothetical protein
MSQDLSETQAIDLVHEVNGLDGVCFDPEHVTLEGGYADQLSAYRARKIWAETLAQSFLLERDHDFKLSVIELTNCCRYALRCQFLTACARYAFWRLTNNQAPEAQYIIETAHIPHAEARQEEFWTAPDLKLKGDPAALAGLEDAISHNKMASNRISSLLERLRDLITRK